MDEFDDIANVLNDLAEFDLSSFDTPAAKPAAAVSRPAPKPAAVSTPSYDNDYDSFDMDFSSYNQTPASSTKSNNNNFDFDFNTDLDLGIPSSNNSNNDSFDAFNFEIPTELDIDLDSFDSPQTTSHYFFYKFYHLKIVQLFIYFFFFFSCFFFFCAKNTEPASARRPPPSRGRGGPAPSAAPQVMNMQPANAPMGRGGPQVMNMSPANSPIAGRGGPQVMNMQPANPSMGRGGPQVVQMQAANMPGSPQVMNMSPANPPMGRGGPQVMNMQPANIPAGGMGRGGPQVVQMQAANMPGSPQVMNMQPANIPPGGRGGPQVVQMQAANMPGSPQVMQMQPANVPRGGPQVMNMQAANMPPGGGGPQVVQMQPANVPKGGPQVMNMQPANMPAGGRGGPQVVQMQAANITPGGPQVVQMQPANMPGGVQRGLPQVGGGGVGVGGPQIVQMQPARKAMTVEEELPDPVPKEIKVRDLSEGRTKLLLTVILADASTKKVYVTDDFTISELRDLFASKLHLWQTEFFDLAVKDSDDEDRWLDVRKTILEERIPDKSEVMFKIKYFKMPKKLVDESALRLFYIQVKQNIINGAYPCSEKLAIRLAAHQVQLTYGNYVPSKHHPGFLQDTLKDYLPREILANGVSTYLEARIYSFHRTLIGKSNFEVMESYLDQAQQIQTFGATLFLIKEKAGRTKRIGVAEDGILISTEENPKKFDFYPFKTIGAWRKVNKGFEFQVISPQNMLLEFEASESKSSSIIELMCGYYIFLLGNNVDDLPLVNLPMQPVGLPNAKMFHKPNNALKRNLSDQSTSRLELFKEELLSLFVFIFI